VLQTVFYNIEEPEYKEAAVDKKKEEREEFKHELVDIAPGNLNKADVGTYAYYEV
jgi:hypothetical protein